jgi:hypothetical protein
MDVNLITQLISNVGSPIVACGYLAWSNENLRRTLGENTRTIESLKDLIYSLHSKDND